MIYLLELCEFYKDKMLPLDREAFQYLLDNWPNYEDDWVLGYLNELCEKYELKNDR